MMDQTRRKRVTRRDGRNTRRLLALALVAATAACEEVEPPNVGPVVPGSIQLTIATTGFLKDDGYGLQVNGESHSDVAADAEVALAELEPGTYEPSLTDVASNRTAESVSVEVVTEESVDATLAVECAYSEANPYTVRFNRERPNLEDASITECPFGLCPTEEGWDLYVYYDAAASPHSVVRQNETTGVEIAHLAGVTLETLTESDYMGVTFTTERIDDSFDGGRVVLLRTDAGDVYALGNPVEDDGAQTLTFDAVLIAVQ